MRIPCCATFCDPFQSALQIAERRHGIHSEVVTAVAESLPEIMAETIAFPRLPDGDGAQAALVRVESDLAARTMRLLIRLLRLSITQTPAYDPAVLDPYLNEAIELAEIIKRRRHPASIKES